MVSHLVCKNYGISLNLAADQMMGTWKRLRQSKQIATSCDNLFSNENVTVWERVTFTALCVNQAISGRTQALEADLQVFANVRASAVVVQALVGACRRGEEGKDLLSFFSEGVQ